MHQNFVSFKNFSSKIAEFPPKKAYNCTLEWRSKIQYFPSDSTQNTIEHTHSRERIRYIHYYYYYYHNLDFRSDRNYSIVIDSVLSKSAFSAVGRIGGTWLSFSEKQSLQILQDICEPAVTEGRQNLEWMTAIWQPERAFTPLRSLGGLCVRVFTKGHAASSEHCLCVGMSVQLSRWVPGTCFIAFFLAGPCTGGLQPSPSRTKAQETAAENWWTQQRTTEGNRPKVNAFLSFIRVLSHFFWNPPPKPTVLRS